LEAAFAASNCRSIHSPQASKLAVEKMHQILAARRANKTSAPEK